ncbi:MAG: PadR family transcriptional regulator [Solibacillus sp.]|jgi:PadR family transcriptional regulator, regulatory protein PadR|uniref:PadR family transcriptional regulator n=1 Tax=unclassified Solibacillus TaxID=2637870 RepID=UPI0030F80060
MNPQFKKGVLNLCVLSLLEKKDMYGYELVQAISTQIEISEGSVYPLLRRLTNDGFFTTYLKESSEGPPRKYYQITKQGIEELKNLKAEWESFITGVNKLIQGSE